MRASLFGAFDTGWLQAWAVVAAVGCAAFLVSVFLGRWKLVAEAELRPPIDVRRAWSEWVGHCATPEIIGFIRPDLRGESRLRALCRLAPMPPCGPGTGATTGLLTLRLPARVKLYK